jgi:cyclopropane-fatty-acyl-phospholipid synthase
MPAAAGTKRATRAGERTLDVLRLLFGDEFAREFSVELWDGTRVPARDVTRFTLRIVEPYGLRAALTPPLDLNPGWAYVDRWIDFTGDLQAAIGAFERAVQSLPRAMLPLLAARLLLLPRPPKRDGTAVGFHFDQPLAFYRAFLDEHLVYSCAYFETGSETLAEAQLAKIDYILRKVRLQPGERILDIGCGWGALVMRAAERFGAQAYGITLSKPQYEEAARAIRERGIAHRAHVEYLDYRELGKRTFDKIVSVGMADHVGRAKLPQYFAAAYRALRPGGLFLNQAIADQSPGRKGGRHDGFVERFVFPDGELVPVSDALGIAERAGFEVRDVESLREQYARTLRCWVANFERNAAGAVAASGERAYRVWHLYVAGSAHGFSAGHMGLFQSLLARPHADGSLALPATRRDLYLN